MKNGYMQKALDEAWKYQFLTYPNPAVGACVVQNDKVLSVEAHHEAGKPHAEVNALKSAYLTKYPNSLLKDLSSSSDIHNFLISNHNEFFYDKEIYVTLEPCNHIGKTPACANLLKSIKIKKVYIGTLDTNNEASGGLETLKMASIDVEYNIMQKECDNLLFPFKLWQKDKFRFFKIAMRKDGSVDGGYITTQDSLNLVHNIRTKLDLLIIGGNTVRIDRPTLDSRFAKVNKSSDILIYSKQIDFDKEINLFKVPSRDVFVSNDMKSVNSNFSMCEGGYTLLNSIKSNIDMVMLFVSHKDEGESLDTISENGFVRVYSYFLNEVDEIVFFRKE